MDTYEEYDRLEQEFGSPFYIFDESNFDENYRAIENAFRSRYKNFIIGYSYKTNYLPYLCKEVKKRGGYAEVVSRLEYDLALRIGQKPHEIIFNGPVKTCEDIELALENQSILNCDSWYELDHVVNYAQKHPHKQIKVGLRVNLCLSDKAGVSHVQEGLEVGRFGFPVGNQGIGEAIGFLKKNRNIKVNCLHGHSSTTSRSLWVYQEITRTLCELASEYLRESIEYIDVGGGIYGKIPPELQWKETPSFEDYAEAICGVMDDFQWGEREPSLILEPGVSMVANTLSFVAKVIEVKKIKNRLFAVVDGSVYNIKPNLQKFNQPYKVFNQAKNDKKSEEYSVVGYTCMEKDYLLTNVFTNEVKKGDFVKIENVGAYTIVLSPPFINVSPPIVVKVAEGFKLLRSRQSFDEFFINYSFD